MKRYLFTLFLMVFGLYLVAEDTPYAGKAMAVIGDSYVANHRRPKAETWHSRVAERLGMNYLNFGRNGGCIAFDRKREGFGPSILDRYTAIPDTVDCILVIAGHNDAYKIGTNADSLQMFRTALDSLCRGLRDHYPKAHLGFVTPWDVPRQGFPEVNATIHEVCSANGIPVLDAATTSGIRPGDADYRQRYFQNTNDQAHLNAEGHGLLLDWGERFVRGVMNQDPDTAYVFTYFDTKKQAAGLCIAYSYDGYNWTAINDGKPVMRPNVGRDKLLRDPSICQAPDGTFHLVWTSSWKEPVIGHASSRDLVNWSEQQAIPVMKDFPTSRNAWAPELFYDEPSGTYYIFWASTVPGAKGIKTEGCVSENEYNHRIYCTTTKDFKKFSKTRLWYNPDFNVIDAAIVRDPQTGELIMAVKNENLNPPEKNIRITRAKSMKSGFDKKVSEPINKQLKDGQPAWSEGPAPLFVGNDLVVFFDMYRSHRFGASVSHDHGKTWEDCTDRISMPKGMSHGTAISVPRSVVDKLKSTEATKL